MKRIIVALVLVTMFTTLALAKADTATSKGSGKSAPYVTETGSKGTSKGAGAAKKAKSMTEMKQMEQTRKGELAKKAEAKKGKAKDVAKKQNRMRLAVHNMLAMEGMLGGIGPEVSKIARDFNNSVDKTEAAETKIKDKSFFARTFGGKDKESAEKIKKEVDQNKTRIKKLKDLEANCKAGDDVKAKLKEQIKIIEEEQSRLEKVAQDEAQ